MKAPILTVVVVSHRMARELPRTLRSLSPDYQRGIRSEDYEVVVVDNGSPDPPREDRFRDLRLTLRCIDAPSVSCSPVAAINLGLRQARGAVIGVFIDGARMASPGLLATALDAVRSGPRAVVGSRGRYLGPGWQSKTMLDGYCQEREDRLLDLIAWQEDGYRLFAASVFDESSVPTWYDPIAESNGLFMDRELWNELGGYDPRFASPGGGLVNLDTWQRAIGLPDATAIVLLGEATFHQFHGGTMTNATDQRCRWRRLCREYRVIRGHAYRWPKTPLHFRGEFRHDPPSCELVGTAPNWWNGWGLPRRVARWLR